MFNTLKKLLGIQSKNTCEKCKYYSIGVGIKCGRENNKYIPKHQYIYPTYSCPLFENKDSNKRV